MPENESRPVPTNTQLFVVPVVVRVDSDEGDVDAIKVRYHLRKSKLQEFLEGELADSLDRDPGMPMPFAFHGASPEWESVFELDTPELNQEIEKVLAAKEQAVLDQDFATAARLREKGKELIQRRTRLSVLMPSQPLLQTALVWALNYAKANVDDLNESYQEKGLVTAEHFEMIQRWFGLET